MFRDFEKKIINYGERGEHNNVGSVGQNFKIVNFKDMTENSLIYNLTGTQSSHTIKMLLIWCRP